MNAKCFNTYFRLIVLCFLLGFVVNQASSAMYDDFTVNYGTTPPNFNNIDGSKWFYTGDDTWQRNGNKASSNKMGDAGQATLESFPIVVGADDYLSVYVTDWKSSNHYVEIWGANAGGIISTEAIGYLKFDSGPDRTMVTDTRGYSHVVLKAIDQYTGGFGWFSITDVQTTNGVARTNFANNSFEDGVTGWSTTGTAFSSQSSIGGNIAFEGGSYATSQVNESLTGTLTSAAITVSRQFLTFNQNGWGGTGTSFTELNENYFLLLDSFMNPVARINPTTPGTWATAQFDLSALGFNAGDFVYLQAVDGRAGGFGWMAFDYVRQTGTILAVPEPSTYALLAFGTICAGIAFYSRKQRQALPVQ